MAQELNLLNPALRPRHDWLAFRSVALGALLAFGVVCAGYGYATYRHATVAAGEAAIKSRQAALQQELQSLQAKLAARVPDPALEEERQKLAAALQQREAVLALAQRMAAPERLPVTEVMRGFSRQRIEGVWLTGFAVTADGIDIRGRLLDHSLLPVYIRRLNSEPAFRGRSFAALDMQSVVPSSGASGETGAKASAAGTTAAEPAAFTEFALRTSLAAETAAGGRK